MNILILSAMVEEIEAIIECYKLEKINCINHQNVYQIKNQKNNIFLSNTGVGKVNAAISTSLLIREYNINLIINIGSAGGVNKKLKIGDFVVANKLVFHDVDVTSFGYLKGQLPKEKQYFEIKEYEKLREFLISIKPETHIGTIATGDTFVDTKKEKLDIEEKFENVYAIEMESASIVMTAQHLNIDCVVLRTISDLAYEKSNVEFNEFLSSVSKQFLEIVKKIEVMGY